MDQVHRRVKEKPKLDSNTGKQYKWMYAKFVWSMFGASSANAGRISLATSLAMSPSNFSIPDMSSSMHFESQFFRNAAIYLDTMSADEEPLVHRRINGSRRLS